MSRRDIAEVVFQLRQRCQVPPELVDDVIEELEAIAAEQHELGWDEVPLGPPGAPATAGPLL